MNNVKIIIRAYQADDQDAAKALILDGLREHWGELDLTLNPDLNNIAASFPNGFFVAVSASTLIATGGIKRVDHSTFQIERMSVARAWRKQGIGKRMLSRLINHALQLGGTRILLETTANWATARKFYEDNGFHFTHYAGDDVYYELRLG